MIEGRVFLFKWILAAGMALGVLLPTGAASAASSVLIWPIDPVLQNEQQSTALWLENKGDSPVNLQIRVLSWAQQGFEEQYQNQREVIGIPQMAQVAPGQKQLIRLTRMSQTPAGVQQAYRVVIDEIPGAVQADGAASATVSFSMRYMVPLFVYGNGLSADAARQVSRPELAGDAAPRLVVQRVLEDGKAYLQVRNDGRTHARLTEVALEHPGKREALYDGLMGYVLPGATMRWPLPSLDKGKGELVMRVNGVPQLQRFAIE